LNRTIDIYQTKDNCEDFAQTTEDNKNNPEIDQCDRDNDCNSSEDNQDDQTTGVHSFTQQLTYLLFSHLLSHVTYIYRTDTCVNSCSDCIFQ